MSGSVELTWDVRVTFEAAFTRFVLEWVVPTESQTITGGEYTIVGAGLIVGILEGAGVDG